MKGATGSENNPPAFDFVESHCQRLKEKLGYKRQSVPIALEILGPGALWVFRKLRVRTFD
jgi:hypothetical protein